MAETPSSFSSVILFDGLCTLCNGSVRWVIEHDRSARFAFASLQSKAAERVLRETSGSTENVDLSNLPDSIVLVDAEGVHTRSDAAIRIARGLGLPWSLMVIFLIVPRPLRDWVYALIARNRYRWFGKRESCMAPAPGLRQRFLDADETEVEKDALADHESILAGPSPHSKPLSLRETNESPGPIWSFFLRCVLAHVVIFVFPFPLGAFPRGAGIPGTDWLAGLHEKLMYAVVPWVADTFMGIKITIFPAGSGDTTYNYVELLLYMIFAVVIAGAWTAIWRGRPLSPRTFDLVTVYVRYYLASIMLVYGLDKVMLLQFPAPGPSRLMVSYGESSPFGLLWTAMGASPMYQFFGGVIEMVGAILLLWRRTSLLGALITVGVLANVVMLNLSYDVPVKIFSAHLLLLALFVASPHLGRVLGVVLFNLPTAAARLRPFPVRSTWAQRVALGVKVLFILWITFGQAWMLHRLLTPSRALAASNPLHGFYRVESFSLDGVRGSNLDDAVRWVQMGIDGRGSAAVRFADGRVDSMWTVPDVEKSELTIRGAGPQAIVLSFAQPSPDVLILEGTWTEDRDLAVRLILIEEPPALRSRGFNWINESPYYR
ncbi:MAG: thiol-disulfide oxidoreductase DCC family protein [Phycisphaerales bacterium]